MDGGLAPLRWLDVVLVVAASPFALLMGAPALGYVVGAVAWIVVRVGGHQLEKVAKRSPDVRREVGIVFFLGMGRAWIAALAVLLAGILGSRPDGLTAALLVFAAFTIYLITGIALRPRRSTTAP